MGLVAAFAVVASAASKARAAEPENGTVADAVEDVLSAEYHDLHIAVIELFERASTEEVCELTTHGHDMIAVLAAWERVRRSHSEQARVEGKANRPFKINQRDLQRFFGFLEGRLEVSLPRWWETQLSRASALPRCDSVVFESTIYDRPNDAAPYVKIRDGFYALKGLSVKELPSSDVHLQINDLSCRIPGRFLRAGEKAARKEPEGPDVYLTACMNEQYCIFAFHFNGVVDIPMHCIERESAALVWSTAFFRLGGAGFSGEHFQWVEIKPRDDRLYVFGMMPQGVYIEGFSIKDGTSVIRFSTEAYR